MPDRPTLLNSCARAASADEARYRVAYPNSAPRTTRIVALNESVAKTLSRLAQAPWSGLRVLTFAETRPVGGIESLSIDATLRDSEGKTTSLIQELAGTDLLVMIASAESDVEGASAIGNACFARGIMTAGLIVSQDAGVDAAKAVAALRPYAAVLVVAASEDYIPDMLTALRA